MRNRWILDRGLGRVGGRVRNGEEGEDRWTLDRGKG